MKFPTDCSETRNMAAFGAETTTVDNHCYLELLSSVGIKSGLP